MSKLPKIILAIILAMGLLLPSCSGSAPAPSVGKPAPDFQLPSLGGQIVTLSDFRGRPVLINFWASWCGPCRYEMPFLQRLHEDKAWADKGLVILAIDIGEAPETVREFVANYRLSFTVLLDTKQEVALAYNVRGIPTTFLIDKGGVIRDIKIGAFASKAEIEGRLSTIIP